MRALRFKISSRESATSETGTLELIRSRLDEVRQALGGVDAGEGTFFRSSGRCGGSWWPGCFLDFASVVLVVDLK